MDIEGKVAIVTGAARGIGRAAALALATAGARAVVAADVRVELARETAGLVGKSGCEAVAVETDVSDLESLRALIDGVCERFGALHILHNNAAVVEGADDWHAVECERLAAVADVNYRGVVLGTRLALEPMRRSGGGAVVNTASGAAVVPLAQQAVYAGSKAGVVHFTRSCAALADSHRVRVSCVCPGLVATEMMLDTGIGGSAPWLQAIVDSVEMLEPRQVADAVVELVRDPDSAGRIVHLENSAKRAR